MFNDKYKPLTPEEFNNIPYSQDENINYSSNVIPFKRKENKIQPSLSREQFLQMFFDSKFRKSIYEKFDEKLAKEQEEDIYFPFK